MSYLSALKSIFKSKEGREMRKKIIVIITFLSIIFMFYGVAWSTTLFTYTADVLPEDDGWITKWSSFKCQQDSDPLLSVPEPDADSLALFSDNGSAQDKRIIGWGQKRHGDHILCHAWRAHGCVDKYAGIAQVGAQICARIGTSDHHMGFFRKKLRKSQLNTIRRGAIHCKPLDTIYRQSFNPQWLMQGDAMANGAAFPIRGNHLDMMLLGQTVINRP